MEPDPGGGAQQSSSVSPPGDADVFMFQKVTVLTYDQV